MELFELLGLDYFLSHVGDVFNYDLFKNCLSAFLFLFFLWDTYNSYIAAFNIVPEVSEAILNSFHSFCPLFCSSSVISIIPPYSSFIHSSASVILLWVPSREFLISVLCYSSLATHSSTLAWKIPWTEEPGRLQSMGSLGVRHN